MSGPRVLVVGVGGIGAPATLALARSGVSALGLVDDDRVERTNLHRQILFDERDAASGALKVDAAARGLERLGARVPIEPLRTRLAPENATALFSDYDVILEGADNFATKFLAADAARITRRPVVHAAALGRVGTVLAVGAGGAPCYRCLFEDVPAGDAPNCATAGVLGPLVGFVGAVAAELALDLAGGASAGTLVTIADLSVRRRLAPARRTCSLCTGPTPLLTAERYAALGCA